MARDVEGIREILPLRYPYLMVDRILREQDGLVVALKNVTINEPFFQGHFPEPLQAVMPGTLILESMAQTAAFLLSSDESAEGYLVGVSEARFRRRVVPGDQLIVTARVLRKRGNLVKAEVKVTVDDELTSTAVISLITGVNNGVE